MAKYRVKCPNCGHEKIFSAEDEEKIVTIVCDKCGYMFKVAKSSEFITRDVDAIAMQINPFYTIIVESILFILLIIGSLFNWAIFLVSLAAIIGSIFFPPLIVFPVILSLYVIFSEFGLFIGIIYMSCVIILVATWIYLVKIKY